MRELQPGDEVAGRYRVIRELARGGMGIVYEASDERLGHAVALKAALAPAGDEASLRARWLREARLGNRLGRTPGFVRVTDWGDLEGGGVYLAMDLVADARELDLTGGPLRARVERLNTAALIVARLHRLRVIHRDLKPSNFLLARDGGMHLTDFGIARALDESDEGPLERRADMRLTATGTTMGTPLYMAPELFEDAKHADTRADVYALGVMLFQAITGRYPYDGEGPVSVISAQLRVRLRERQAPRVRDHAQVPPALDEVVARAMALDPAARLADAGAVVEALERAGWRAALAGDAREGAPRARSDAVTIVDAGAPGDASGAARGSGTEVSPTLGAFAAEQALRARARCGACGSDDGVRGARCVRCGASARLPAAGGGRTTTPVLRPRDEVGAGLALGGAVPVPRAAWFVVGLTLVVGVGLAALPGAPRAAGALVAPEEVPEAERALFERVHQAWSQRAASQPEVVAVDPLALLDPADAAAARAVFVRLACGREGPDRAPVTRGASRHHELRRSGDGPLEVRRAD